MTRLRLLAGVALLLAPLANAQVGQIEVGVTPQIPVTGLPAEVTVEFLESRPSAASLFVRTVSETAYQELVATDQGNGLWKVALPFNVPAQGLEVYARYVLDGETFTEPEQNATGNPFRVPAFSAVATSAISLPARQYRMVSVPLQLGAVSGVTEQLGSDAPIDVFGDDFGPGGNPSLWRLLRWDPRAELYRDAVENAALFERVRPGIGYWLITSAGGPFDAEAGISAGVEFDGSEPFAAPVSIPLRTGWNQIGNPFFFPISWASVERPGAVEDPVAFSGQYVGGQTTLRPWEGYFVFNPGPETQLRFRATPATDGIVDDRPLPERMRERAGPGAATLGVTARSGDASDTVYLGLGGGAGDAPLDLRKPPAVDEGLRLSMRDAGDEWIGQFQPRASAEWDLTVTAPSAVTLHLTAYGEWPGELVVEDLDRNRTLPVEAGQVTVAALSGVPVRSLRLRLAEGADEAPRGLAPTLGVPRPNPSTDALSVPYALSARSRVAVEVVDVLGRVVRQQDEGERAAGTHSVRWDGRDGDGQPVAAGVYLLRLRTDAGAATVRVTRLSP